MERSRPVPIMIDTEFNIDGCPVLDTAQVLYFGLHEGDQVLAYQEDEQWKAEVKHKPFGGPWGWCVELEAPSTQVSTEIMEGRSEGFRNGVAFGKLLVANSMFKDGLSLEVIKKYTGVVPSDRLTQGK